MIETNNTHFKLTFRPDDLRELYASSTVFKLFSKSNYNQLLYLALFLILILLSLFGLTIDKSGYFLVIIFLYGLVRQIINLIQAYLRINKNKTEVEAWIKTIQKYSSHSIELDNKALIYTCDQDVFLYEFSEIKNTYRTEDFFYLALHDNQDIVLPKKSFETGMYDSFLKCFDKLNT